MQIIPTNKYVVWTSPTTGEYVRANKVEEFDGKIIFIKTDGAVDKVVKDYKYSDVIKYHEVKEN